MTTQHVIWFILVGLFIVAILVRTVCRVVNMRNANFHFLSLGNVDDEFFVPGDRDNVEYPLVDYADVYEEEK